MSFVWFDGYRLYADSFTTDGLVATTTLKAFALNERFHVGAVGLLATCQAFVHGLAQAMRHDENGWRGVSIGKGASALAVDHANRRVILWVATDDEIGFPIVYPFEPQSIGWGYAKQFVAHKGGDAKLSASNSNDIMSDLAWFSYAKAGDPCVSSPLIYYRDGEVMPRVINHLDVPLVDDQIKAIAPALGLDAMTRPGDQPLPAVEGIEP